jgi:hypothetical protein
MPGAVQGRDARVEPQRHADVGNLANQTWGGPFRPAVAMSIAALKGPRYITGCLDGIKIGDIQLLQLVAIHEPPREFDSVADRLIPIALSRACSHGATIEQIHDADYAHRLSLRVGVLCSLTANIRR